MNAAAASLDLRENPGAEEHFAFFVSIRYNSKPGQPMQKRFSFVDARAVDMRTNIPAIDAMTMSDTSLETKAAKKQLGRFYAGTGTYCIIAVFDTMVANMTPHKFVIDRPVSRAKRHPEWYALLRDYITQGRKMRFCCRKLAAGTCCCGGWTHPSAVNQAHVENVQAAQSHATIEEVGATESV
ncbi:hypothetical protein EWM64_g5479 [Hericium alpestre]|uniref:Uncharacterized protein n=1 Tax=Hericium alpestre TaxID=135208 RepID=A0A4Y9ZXA0_9AGAM|nr:hypothetical protein EWM64_g5479 [Hericium alpestre]